MDTELRALLSPILSAPPHLIPRPVLADLRARVSDRKLRLFGCACCRTAGLLLKDSRSQWVVEMAERCADGLASERELAAAAAEAADAADDARDAAMKQAAYAVGAAHADALQAARGPWLHIARAEIQRRFASQMRERYRVIEGKFYRAEQKRQTPALRCIVGNPLRPVAFAPAWRTEHTVGIAAKVYEERDFAAMPILGDALEEAGCVEAGILTHCREPGVHVRACWVVDLLLSKE